MSSIYRGRRSSPFGRTSRGHTGGRPTHRSFFFISPPSFCGACLSFFFIARMVQPGFSSPFSLVDREVEFCYRGKPGKCGVITKACFRILIEVKSTTTLEPLALQCKYRSYPVKYNDDLNSSPLHQHPSVDCSCQRYVSTGRNVKDNNRRSAKWYGRRVPNLTSKYKVASYLFSDYRMIQGSSPERGLLIFYSVTLSEARSIGCSDDPVLRPPLTGPRQNESRP